MATALNALRYTSQDNEGRSMRWLEDWYDWFMGVVHTPLAEITLTQVAGVVGTAFLVVVVGGLLLIALFDNEER